MPLEIERILEAEALVARINRQIALKRKERASDELFEAIPEGRSMSHHYRVNPHEL